MLKKTAKFAVVFRNKKREVNFKKSHKIGINSFTRERKLGFDKIMSMIIKKSNKSIQNSINDMLLDLGEEVSISNSAYTQARAKLNYTAFKEYAEMASDMFYEDGEYTRYKNFRLLAIDGSVVRLPSSKDIGNEFNPMNVRCQIKGFKKEVPQGRASVLFDVLNNIAVDSSFTNKNNSKDNDLIAYDERTLALEHLEYCKKEDLVVMDRGYHSYELFVKYAQKTNFLVRLPKTTFSKAKFLFDAHSQKKDVILEINAPKTIKASLKRENLATKMKVRFIQVILDNGTVEVLATNILNNDTIKTTDFKELYIKRWGIETYYDLIKNRLNLENFTGLTALAVKQDFYATIFLTNYEAMLTYDLNEELKETTQENKYVQKINKAVSFNLIKHKVFDLLYNDEPIDEMLEKMEKLFLTNTIVIRPNRPSNPRLDKDAQKSTISTNTIHHLKRKKKNVGS
jgi:hypothetical protein